MAVERAFDYSKWDHIDISDDESDCHPNIEKETWFRLKRRQRAEKEQEQNARKAELQKGVEEGLARVAELEQRIAAVSIEGDDVEGDDPTALAAEAKEIKQSIDDKKKELESIERNKTWNWENICHVTEERTIINKSGDSEAQDTLKKSALPPKLAAALGAPKSAVTGPESTMKEIDSYAEFVEEHEGIMEEYSVMKSMTKTKEFLMKHGDIMFADHCQSYLLLACLEDEMNGKHERMKLVSRQSHILSSVTELAVSLRRPPQDVVPALFARLAEKEHYQRFNEGVDDFILKVQKRAVEKRKEMDAEAREEKKDEIELSKEERMGPGGLDPVEVFSTLPEEMQMAFETKDMDLLKKALTSMTPQKQRYHMKRCEDSGLWVPGPGGSISVEGEDEDASDEEEGKQNFHEKAGQAGGESTTEGRVLHQSPRPSGDGSAETD